LPDAVTPERVAALAFGLFILVPFGVFLATCTRLSASTRDRRIAGLRLLGVSARQAALVNAVETGVVAAVGSLFGYGLFRILGPRSQSWHLSRLHWWARDLTLPAVGVVVVLGAVVGFAVVVGVAASRAARLAPVRVSRQAPPRRPRLWRLGPLLIGLVLASVAAGLDSRGTVPLWLLGGAVVVTGLGLPLALAPLGWVLAGIVRRLPRASIGLELGAARLRHSPGIAPRQVGALAVAVYVIGMGSLGTALYEQRLGPYSNPTDIYPTQQIYRFTSDDPALVASIQF
jgi:predicted lysophospholipase L1 biosynthesis ABC-type transport system permease subunit